VFLGNGKLTLECHTWGAVDVPADFRDRDVLISTPPITMVNHDKNGGPRVVAVGFFGIPQSIQLGYWPISIIFLVIAVALLIGGAMIDSRRSNDDTKG
jgi:hypothetical protein